jgi:DNA-binding PadR family transcriptional regulator
MGLVHNHRVVVLHAMRSKPATRHSASREALGEFEQLVLLAIVQLGDGVYGVPIAEEIERRTGRSVSRAAVYVTLRRLEQKGLLSSTMSDPTPERGGKARRCVAVTGTGLESLRAARQALDSMWKGLDPGLRSHR